MRAAALFIVGILAANAVAVPLWLSYLLLLIVTLLVAVGSLRTPGSLTVALGFHVIVLLVAFHLAALQGHTLRSELLVPNGLSEPISLVGYVESEPSAKQSRMELLVRSSAITRNDTTMELRRRVLVILRDIEKAHRSLELGVGDNISVRGELERLPGPRNPGDFDYGRYLALNGVRGIVVVRDTGGVERSSGERTKSFSSLIGSLQREIYHVLDRFHASEQASFLKGIVFGYRADISLEIKQSFIDTGTIHILAVSGSNVLVVALIVHSLVSLFRLSRRWTTVLTIFGLVIYMFTTGLSPSVIRATIMGAAILLGTLFERKTDVYNSLAAAAFVMLLVDPMVLFDVGFQLSFAAVVSIVYFYPKLESLIKRIPERFEEIKGIDYVLKLLAVSLAAQIGTLPFTAYYFGRVSLVSILANLVVVPISGVNVILGFTTLAFSCVSMWVAECYATLNGALVSFLLGFVSAAAKAPLAYIETSTLPASVLVLYYLGIGTVFNLRNRHALAKILIALFLALNAFLYADILASRKPTLALTVIDVGQGDALLLEFPNNRRLLIDAGPKSFDYDAGERIVGPFLARKGIRQLDAIVVSHGHSDHIGGVRFLLDNFKVGRLVEPEAEASSALYRDMVEAAKRRGVTVQRASAGDTLAFDPSIRVFILSPHPPKDSSRNLNNTSLVLKVLYARTSLLLVGDAEERIEDKLVRRYRSLLPSTVLKAGHHGSKTSSSRQFLDHVQPKVALISVGRNNKLRHPSPEVIERFQKMRIDVRRTDRDGALVLRSDGERLTVVDWRE